MATKRDSHGRFVKGHCGGPGRPPRPREERYHEITIDSVPFDTWRSIVLKAAEQAQRGNAQARDWLSKYLLGLPNQPHSGDMSLFIEYINDWRQSNDGE